MAPVEFEITISRTRRGGGGEGRTARDRRLFQLKVRVRVTKPMTDDQVFAAVKRAARSRMVPDGLEIDFLDWQSGRAERMRQGSYTEPGKTLDALHDFNAMIQAGLPRIERVSEP